MRTIAAAALIFRFPAPVHAAVSRPAVLLMWKKADQPRRMRAAMISQTRNWIFAATLKTARIMRVANARQIVSVWTAAAAKQIRLPARNARHSAADKGKKAAGKPAAFSIFLSGCIVFIRLCALSSCAF